MLLITYMPIPLISYLGEEYLKKIDCCLVKKDGYNNIYDKTVNPQMLTEFISAAFRFLHSMIVNKVEYVFFPNL